MTAERDFFEDLTTLGLPVFHAPIGGSEFERPTGWQSLTAQTNRSAWTWLEDDGGALMACTGGRAAVIDVDTKNGADPDKVLQLLDGIGVRVYADVLTPSGGRHFYVAGHPDLPSVSATADRVGLTGYPGVEVLSFGRNVFLPGTTRPKYDGAGYVVLANNLAALADGGDEDSADALVGWVSENRTTSGSSFTPSPPWDGTPPDRRQQAYLDAALSRMREEVGATIHGGRNDALHHAALAVGNYVAGAGMDEAKAIDTLLDAARANGLASEDGERACLATIHSGIRYGRTRPRAVPEAKGVDIAPATTTEQTPTSSGDRLAALGSLVDELRQWQHLPDPTHVVVALAAAAGRSEDGEPCWLLLVAPPSSGKTEAVRLLDETADARLDEVTPAGLLGWTKGKTVRPSGVLMRVGPRALLTIGDLSTLLATSDRGGRDQVFALLRRAYDGHTSRDISPPGKIAEGDPERLEWSGRLTVVGCVTGAIDRYTAHADQLGARWLYVRLPERGTAAKRQAAALARRGGLAERRAEGRGKAAALLAAATMPQELPDDLADQIEDAALVTAWGRGAVPRSGYGRRDIEGVPVVEEPMRLVQQLGALARGVLALGLPVEAAEAITRRVALDSMPEARRAVLEALATGEVLTTSGVGRAAAVDRKVARFNLEELAAIGVVEHDRGDDEEDEITGAVHWTLAGDDGALIADVIGEHKRSGGWDEKWVLTPTSPPERGEEEESTGTAPTLRPTPEGPSCPSCGGPIEATRAALGYACLSCKEAS